MKDGAKYQVSARNMAQTMDEVTAKVYTGDVNVSVGSLAVNQFKAILQAHKLQIEESKLSGKPLLDPIVDMS